MFYKYSESIKMLNPRGNAARPFSETVFLKDGLDSVQFVMSQTSTPHCGEWLKELEYNKLRGLSILIRSEYLYNTAL